MQLNVYELTVISEKQTNPEIFEVTLGMYE